MTNYQALNQRLQDLLTGFDLNQTLGGCSLSVFHQGQCVVQLAHGVAQRDKLTGEFIPWTPHTLALNFSTGKGVLVTLIHVLVSQGMLAYDVPIAEFWPAFAQAGKSTITLRQVLSHTAGLYDIHQVTTHAKDMLDWDTMLHRVAQMSPTHPLATVPENANTVAYSALVSGWVLGGLIEQVTQLSLQAALESYLLVPLGLVGQVYFGIPADKLTQVATLLREKEGQTKPTLVEDNSITLAFYQRQPIYSQWQQHDQNNHSVPSATLNTQRINSVYFSASQVKAEDYKTALVPVGSRQFNYYHPASLQARIPAANGVASSFALATLYAMLANQGVWQGHELIRPAIFEQLSQLQNAKPDKVMPATMYWRLGYHRVFSIAHDIQHAFGHMGYNGSQAWCDPSRGLALAFTHNYDVTMLNDVRQFLINETVLEYFD